MREGDEWERTLVLVSVQVVQPASVKTGRTADDAVDFIALREKEFGPDQR